MKRNYAIAACVLCAAILMGMVACTNQPDLSTPTVSAESSYSSPASDSTSSTESFLGVSLSDEVWASIDAETNSALEALSREIVSMLANTSAVPTHKTLADFSGLIQSDYQWGSDTEAIKTADMNDISAAAEAFVKAYFNIDANKAFPYDALKNTNINTSKLASGVSSYGVQASLTGWQLDYPYSTPVIYDSAYGNVVRVSITLSWQVTYSGGAVNYYERSTCRVQIARMNDGSLLLVLQDPEMILPGHGTSIVDFDDGWWID